MTQMCVGGVEWTQTFINHCFRGIFDPFLSKISCKFTVNVKVLGWVHKFWSIDPNETVFFCGFPLIIHVEFVQSRSRAPRSHSCSPLPPVLCVHCGREAARPILTSLACLTCALLCSACPDACCCACKNKVRQTPRQNMKI